MPSRKPTAVKTAVIAKTVAGKTKTQIAKELGVTRNTVRRILNESEIDQILGEGKSAIMQLVPHAAKRYGQKVKRSPEEAKDFLERMEVLPARRIEQASGSINFTLGVLAEEAMKKANASDGKEAATDRSKP